MMKRARVARVVAALAVPLAAVACKSPQATLDIVVPALDGGACNTFARVSCVNYLEFTAPAPGGGFQSQCVKVGGLATLCDVMNLATGGELFKLPPETPLPISVIGKRVFPATGCGSGDCDRVVFRGTTTNVGVIGDYVGRSLELAINIYAPCGPPEHFYFPDGGTCASACGSEAAVICEDVAGGCLCLDPMTAVQGGIDGSQQPGSRDGP
jgi:hypothetical protein